MISAAVILLALSGQYLSSSTSNALFPDHQIWDIDPDFSVQPKAPSVFQGWDRDKEKTFSFAKCEVNTSGDTISRDTTKIAWDPVSRFYSEEHRTDSKPNGLFGTARHILIHAYGIDTARSRRGRTPVDSIFHWNRDSTQQTWRKVSSMTSRDTANGKTFDLWSVGSIQTATADTVRFHILERQDAAGFLTFRRTEHLDTLRWRTSTKDSIQRDAEGMPQRILSWSSSDGRRMLLAKDGKFAWNSHSLAMFQATSNAVNRQGIDTTFAYTNEYRWSQGRLDSMESELFPAGLHLALTYDAQGNVATYSRAGNTERYQWDTSRRMVSLRTILQFSLERSDTLLYSVDSFEYDAIGRISREIHYPYAGGSAPNRNRPTITLYDYSFSVPVRTPAHDLRGSVYVRGKTILATGLPTGIVLLRILRLDGRLVRQTEGDGTVRMDLSGLDGSLLLWSLEQDGRSLGSGKFFPAP